MTIMKYFGRVTRKCQSKKEYEQHKFTWLITDYHKCYNICGDFHQSPVFQTGIYKWTLDLFVAGYSNREHIAIRPNMMNLDEQPKVAMRFVLELSILDKKDVEHSTATAVLTEKTLNKDESVFKRFILKSDLSSGSELLTDNDLRIACQISFEVASDKAAKSIEEQDFSSDIQSNVLKKLLDDDDEFSDFSFVIKDKEFKVHRAILATASPVFRAMFESKMRESDEGKVYVDDVEPEVMEKLLRFVYIGEADDAFGRLADKILIAAEKYQLDSLKRLCETVLGDELTVGTVYDTLRLADKYRAGELQNRAMDFFCERIAELRAAENFKTAVGSLPMNLQTDIICAVANKL